MTIQLVNRVGMQCSAALMTLLLVTTIANAETIDTFRYTSDEVASQDWKAGDATSGLSNHEGSALQINASLSNKGSQRAMIDHTANFDFTVPTYFSLETKISDAEMIGKVSLYFQSPGGWFVCTKRAEATTDWQTIRFDKLDFRKLDSPSGWEDISRIRIAFYRAATPDAPQGNMTILLRDLSASWNLTTFVVSDSSDRNARTLAKMLGELGIGVDQLTESSLSKEVLAKRKLVLLPNNQPNDATCELLEQFVDNGGKLFLGYSLPRPLQKVLGFQRGSYYKPSDDQPKLTNIRFASDVQISGLPRSVDQASWNIATADPAGHGARVIASWHDENGDDTGKPAMLISDRGAYFSHVVLHDDWEGKKQLMAAVLGYLSPDLWREITKSDFSNTEHIGHFSTAKELEESLENDAVAVTQLRKANEMMTEAHRLLADGRGWEACEAAKRCRDLRVDTYLQSQPSPAREARAFWDHKGTGAYPGDWDRTCSELAAAGINMIIPNMLWSGAAHYPSDVLPRSSVFTKHGDQIQQCVDAAKKHGLEVHVWKVCFRPGSEASPDFITRMKKEGRTQVDVDGKGADWLNPAHPDNFKSEVESLLEVVRKYDVDGIHLDYIRFPYDHLDYSDFSRTRFRADTGLEINNWPEDCYTGELKDAYCDWRASLITRLVETVSREARKIRPGVKISAAIKREYPHCRTEFGQDWPVWAQRGYVDFLCPMNYTEEDWQFASWVKAQKKLAGQVPLYPGIGLLSSRSTLSVDRVVGQIQLARDLGTGGFTIFQLSSDTAETILPGLSVGACRTRAIPPHRQ